MRKRYRYEQRRWWRLGLMLVLCLSTFARSEPVGRPIGDVSLRLETGMHLATIQRIATDAESRWLATASHDKTLRIWDLHTGSLLRTLRPMVGEGAEGQLNAVALSPDGRWLATGGWTGKEQGGEFSIVIIERATGKLVRRIAGLSNVVLHLTYSKDGRWLAATLAQDSGIRVYATADFRLIGQDAGYGRRNYSADFDSNGRLLTTSIDGYLRLYRVSEKGLRLLAKESVSGGREPVAARFSPDGTRIAVGFYDSTAITVLDGQTLALAYAPDTTGVDNGCLCAVAWSAGGDALYAGGTYQKNGAMMIRAWRQGGTRGLFRPGIFTKHDSGYRTD